jgi:hypothetical protein
VTVSLAVCLGLCLEGGLLLRKAEAVNLRNVGLVFSFVFLFVNVCAGREPVSDAEIQAAVLGRSRCQVQNSFATVQ